MIPYTRNSEPSIPASAVKIIGLGGAGANMLERIALDGMEGTELLALNTDIRTLSSCIAKDKIQLGTNLTRGLGAGGDPELGQKAALEAENEIRAALKGRRIVFICAGLGGGTGSGAAPLVTRIAREEGAFVVVFATIPFTFEGQRRRDQADASLNELAVLANALVTFDNNRMGELVLAKQGIHDAFVAADHMISESIKAVIRLVVRPGLINVGLDELMTALKTNRSRCLFGSGLASGKDRASKALRNALTSPLLDQGTLLKETQSVLVHLCGGEDLTLFEIELLMQQLQKHVPPQAHVLFGAAVDPTMNDSLSITLISALPEESLALAPRSTSQQTAAESPATNTPRPAPPLTPAPEWETPSYRESAPSNTPPAPETKPEPVFEPAPAPVFEAATEPAPQSPHAEAENTRSLFDSALPFAEADDDHSQAPRPSAPATITASEDSPSTPDEEPTPPKQSAPKDDTPVRFVPQAPPEFTPQDDGPLDHDDLDEDRLFSKLPGLRPIPEKRSPGEVPRYVKPREFKAPVAEMPQPASPPSPAPTSPPTSEANDPIETEVPRLKLGVKSTKPQNDLALDTVPRGRFEGENPNVVDGEDLDLPPFLRKKK